MAYFFDPNSYASTLCGRSPPFIRRQPSPPSATYYPREAADPYIHALAEEQAARAALQDAIKREREARQKRTEEEAKATMRERMRERERARQRPQSMYSYAPGYGYPNYGSGFPGFAYPEYGYSPANYGAPADMDMDYEDEYHLYTPYCTASRPVRESLRRQPQPAPGLRTARSQSRAPTFKHQPSPPRQPSPATEAEFDADAPKVSIPISSPSDKPEPSLEEKNAAASRIQSAYRIHGAFNAINAVRQRFSSLLTSFTFPSTLDFDLSNPPQGDERPRLMYNSNNTPLHGYEDGLMKLPQTLDAVESHGDKDVREKRRELVREVESELERVDKEVRKRYEEVVGANAKVQEQPVQDGDAWTEEKMNVEPEAQSAPQQAVKEASEEKMDEYGDRQAPAVMHPPDEADASTAMDVKPSTSAVEREPEPEPITTASEPIIEEASPVGATNDNDSLVEIDAESDSGSEVEVETPPQASVPLPQPHVTCADSPPAPSNEQDQVVQSNDVEMQKDAGSASAVPPVPSPFPSPASPEHPKTHRVTVEEADDCDDAEEIVIVEEGPYGLGPESSPVLNEEFVVV